MAKGANQKSKLLVLYQLLLERTDEENPLSTQQIIEYLEQNGIGAERKSIYADMETLRDMGVDVQSRKGRGAGWFIGERDFQLAELKLLMDAVQSSRFITQRKSDALIRKLEGLASKPQARQLQRQVYVSGRIKTMNESIYYNVDKLHAAIAARKVITFKYFDYDMKKEKVFRQEGRRYTVTPFGLIWDSENYYLAAYDHNKGQLRHYRVDKMWEIALTTLPRQGEREFEGFNPADYTRKHFGMYRGEEVNVKLRGRANMVNVVLDRFGQDVILIPDGEEHFTVTLPVVVSPQFFGWLFGLDGGLEIVHPQNVVEKYREHLRRQAEQYL
jgi:predicted DNA-binding transcriptional regulator YafY